MFTKFFKTLLLVSVALTLVPGERSQAQETGKVIVVSPKVGEVIDRQERDTYKLYQSFDDFQSAIFRVLPDSSYAIHITYLENEVQKTQVWKISRQEFLENYKKPIDHFDPSASALDSERPVRTHRRVGLSFVADVYFSKEAEWYLSKDVFIEGGALPLPGLQLNVALTPHFALDLQVSSIGVVTFMSVGAKGFFIKSRWAPYGFLRAGFMHLIITIVETTRAVSGTAYASAGIELSGFSGFNFFLELGPVLHYSKDFVQFLGKVTLGLGYRFLGYY